MANFSSYKDTTGNLVEVELDSNGNVPIALQAPASESVIGQVIGSLAAVSAEFTRPANTTAYTAKDAVADSTSSPTILTFSNIARVNAGSGYITKARIMTDQSTNIAAFRLHIYTTSITAINDNAAFTLLYANRASRVGIIDFSALTTEGSGSNTANNINATVRLPFVCAAESRTLYGLLEAVDAFTPASGQKFYIELTADQN